MKKQTNKSTYFRENNSPKYISCYDNGGLDKEKGTCDRYTVIFTRAVNIDLQNGKMGTYFGVGMSGAPYYPQGFCQSFEFSYRVDKPKYSHLGKRIGFFDLPKDCQKVVLDDYNELYDLKENN